MIFYITGPDHSGKSTLAKEIIRLRKANYIHSDYNKEWNLEEYHDNIGQMALTLNKYGQDVVLDRWCLDAYAYRKVNIGNSYNPRNLWNSYLHEFGNSLVLIYCLPANEFDPNKREEMFNSEEMVDIEKEFNELFSVIPHYTYFYKTDGKDMEAFINRCIKLQELDPIDYSWKVDLSEGIEKITNFSLANPFDGVKRITAIPSVLFNAGKVDESKIDYSSIPKTVAVDFDGTLSLNAVFPACGDLNIDLVNELYNGTYKDYKKVLFTNRTGKSLDAAVEWCNENGIVFDAINENIKEVLDLGLNPRKIWFDIFIDDKVINVKDVKYVRK